MEVTLDKIKRQYDAQTKRNRKQNTKPSFEEVLFRALANVKGSDNNGKEV